MSGELQLARGPIWMPMQLMLIRALVNRYAHLGNNFKVSRLLLPIL
jgi:hypothetical protein